MNYLEEKIQREGEIRPGNILNRAEGYRLESLAIIEYMDYESQTIRFRE